MTTLTRQRPVGTTGTARNGAHGRVVEFFSNGVLFQQDNGPRYTLLSNEFIPDAATPNEARAIRAAQAAQFGHIGPHDGFHWRTVRRHGRITEVSIRRLVEYACRATGAAVRVPA